MYTYSYWSAARVAASSSLQGGPSRCGLLSRLAKVGLGQSGWDAYAVAEALLRDAGRLLAFPSWTSRPSSWCLPPNSEAQNNRADEQKKRGHLPSAADGQNLALRADSGATLVRQMHVSLI